MVWIPGGTFRMGSNRFYPEERPVHRASVDGFWMDAYPVSNAAFAAFVEQTGYRTVAERLPEAELYPGVDATWLVPGSLCFRQPARGASPVHGLTWWRYQAGACWRYPEGPGSTLAGRENHPVVHVAFADAMAYAGWAGKALPTEAEWELAARGGLDQADYAWGNEFAPGGRLLANTWQGEFPWHNLALDGYAGSSPAGAFPPNGFGLYDMTGNVWEWTSDWYQVQHMEGRACCIPHNPRVNPPPQAGPISRRVLKGGSYLCAPNYCQRYRPAARQGQAADSGACHIGFRCIVHGVARHFLPWSLPLVAGSAGFDSRQGPPAGARGSSKLPPQVGGRRSEP